MKEIVLKSNRHTMMERLLSWLNRGPTPKAKEDDLQWRGHKLFIE